MTRLPDPKAPPEMTALPVRKGQPAPREQRAQSDLKARKVRRVSPVARPVRPARKASMDPKARRVRRVK